MDRLDVICDEQQEMARRHCIKCGLEFEYLTLCDFKRAIGVGAKKSNNGYYVRMPFRDGKSWHGLGSREAQNRVIEQVLDTLEASVD